MPAKRLRSNQSNNPGDQNNTYGGRVISVKLGDKTCQIGIDGSTDAIIKTIKSVFGLRTERAFWLEDVDNIVRVLDRDMPLGNYTLHLDEGLIITLCDPPTEDSEYFSDSEDHSEDKIFYTEDDFCDFLSRRGWTCLIESNSSRECGRMHELSSGGIYYGLKQ